MKSSSFLTQIRPGCFRLIVHAKPGARATSLACRPAPGDASLEVKIAAPPVDGKANVELVAFMQALLEQQQKQLKLLSSNTSNAEKCSFGDIGKKQKSKKAKHHSEDSGARPPSLDGGEYADTKVRVSLVGGATSRNKVLEVLYPGSEEEVLHALSSADVS
ncbi:putative ACR YggU family [Trypanosoma vivax]|uniref:Uncharacterized protein n=1 Tax=Trypanosoma vivax (strain Y486) TaxID=1055687 RepID=G0TUJ5_TRYVY|nr:hypothetical protein TRVL_03708 [Trypanosoma vivax]KAH8607415.1 putative ACR YggU family [Trypanosoma vivax]CCC47629.1 conserved hypothetical protein [Trypanosoma vivax Y486]